MPLVASAGAVAPDIDEIGSALPWRRRVVMIGNAQRNILPRQQAQDVSRIPGGMAKLKAVAACLRQQVKEGFEPLGIGMEIRRELKQDRSGLVAEKRKAVLQQLEAVDGFFRKPLPVGDEFGRLPGEDKILSGLLAPAFHRLRRWRAIEHAVQLGGRKLAGIILKLP